jgi:hypothetical protein
MHAARQKPPAHTSGSWQSLLNTHSLEIGRRAVHAPAISAMSAKGIQRARVRTTEASIAAGPAMPEATTG